MIGVNCTKPAYIVSLIREFRTATDLPIAVYPNSGEEYDPVTKTWHGTNDKRTFMTMLYLISRMELQLLVAAAPQ